MKMVCFAKSVENQVYVTHYDRVVYFSGHNFEFSNVLSASHIDHLKNDVQFSILVYKCRFFIYYVHATCICQL